MQKARITFSNGSELIICKNEYLIPIKATNIDDEGEKHVSIYPAVYIEQHIHNGLIPSILDVTTTCDFFYVNDDFDTVYGSKTIVKIELV